jgi:RNA polymerase sigma factor for flagellar operon FliA
MIDRYARQVEAAERDTLLREHGGLVHRIARRVSIRIGRDDVIDDLTSVGLVALFESHQRFDPTQGIAFSTFAYQRIHGAMLDEARRLDILPRRLRARAVLLKKRTQELTSKLARDPTREELAQATGWTVEKIDEIQMMTLDFAPLEEIDQVASDQFDPLEDIINVRQETVFNAIGQISTRLQTVLSLRFVEEFSVKEIGDLLGVSKTRAHGLIQEALMSVRTNLGIEGPREGANHERTTEDPPRKASAHDG